MLSERAEALNDSESWRELRNVAAAYGEKEVAVLAQKRMAAALPDSNAGGPRHQGAPGQEDSMVTTSLQIRSLTPLARTAWLSCWATRQGVSLEKSGDTYILEGRRTLLEKLNDHPELIVL